MDSGQINNSHVLLVTLAARRQRCKREISKEILTTPSTENSHPIVQCLLHTITLKRMLGFEQVHIAREVDDNSMASPSLTTLPPC